MSRSSYRVRFAGGSSFELAGIVDRPDDIQSFPVAVFAHCFTCNKDLKAIARISRGLSELGIALSDLDAYVLYRGDDGKLRGIHLPYVTMTGVEVNIAG